MKKRNNKSALFSISIVLFCVFLSGAIVRQEDTKARIKEASSIFLGPADPSVTSALILKSILELLDITAALTPESQYKTDIQYRIDVAKDLFQRERVVF
jgi:hypothetical protein